MAKDYYETLGISRTADADAVKSAFRKRAREYHPDLNPDDADAERKFKEINEANEVLSDPDKRAKYDRYGDDWMNADRIEAQTAASGSPFGRTRTSGGRATWTGGGGARFDFDLDDLINDLRDGGAADIGFGSNPRYRRRSSFDVPLTITLEEAYKGGKRQVNLPAAAGGRRIEVAVPRAVDDGSRVHISLDDGAQVFFIISVSPHKRFTRDGDDLRCEVSVPFEDAILGGEVEVDTLKGRLALTIPRGSAAGQRIRIPAHGMPRRSQPSAYGDLYVAVKPEPPANLSQDEEDLLRQFKRLRIDNGKRGE